MHYSNAYCNVRIRKYDNVFNDLPRLIEPLQSVLLPSKYAYSGGVSYAIYETVYVFNQLLIYHEIIIVVELFNKLPRLHDKC